MPKYDNIIPYDDDQNEAGIYVNPPANTISKCIDYDARALIYSDGKLVVWDQANMYHQDVYDFLKWNTDFLTLKLNPPGNNRGDAVDVKGSGEPDTETPFTDEKWLNVIHNNKALVQLYGRDFNWW